ncbi:MAG: hypothetical protein AAFS10_27135, partial [Myxococcota bacterium]
TEMEAAGFEVDIRAYTHTFEAASLAELWDGMRKSHIALHIVKPKLTPQRYEQLLQQIEQRLATVLGTGPQQVAMPAWLGLGRL